MRTKTRKRDGRSMHLRSPLSAAGILFLAMFTAGASADDSLKLYDRNNVPDPDDVARMLQTQKSALRESGRAKTRGISLDRQDSNGVERALAQQNEKAGAFAVQINFPLNSAEVAGDFIPHLEAIAKGIEISGSDTKIVIEGHTDASGTEAYNEELSLRRAQAVRSLLIEKYAVHADKIVASGYGPRQLADASDPYSGKNRRVQFRVVE
jgi:OmpA-OmpF porin, OOP family